MIVCICHNVSDRKIRAAIDDGARTMPALRAELGVGTCCGKCHSCAKAVLRDHLEAVQEVESAWAPVMAAA